MAALDTKVLVRFLVEDDAAKPAAARRLIRRCIAAGRTFYVPVLVTLELEWVLRSNFGFGKGSIVQTFAQLFSAAELVFESEGAVEIAVAQYSQEVADYADCLRVVPAVQAGEAPLWTFDKAVARVEGARLLTT